MTVDDAGDERQGSARAADDRARPEPRGGNAGDERPVDYIAADDVLASTAPLVFEAVFPFLGLQLRVRSNARAAIDLATRAFGVWRALDPTLIDPVSTIEFRVIVHDPTTVRDAAAAEATEAASTDVMYRRHGPVLMAADGASMLSVNLDQRLGVAFVPSSAFARQDWYLWHVHGLVRFAASALDRHPFHAATVLVDDTAVLITGASGCGKSTLAYACARRGLPLLAEEVTRAATLGDLRLWGHAEHVTLGADAERFFPEVAAWPVRRLPSGKNKRECPISAGEAGPLLTHQGPLALCVLTPPVASTPVSASAPLSEGERTALLDAAPEPGFDQFPESHARWRHALRRAPAWRLSIGHDLDAAVSHLSGLIRSG
jgi:hypothetical protein